VKVLNIVYKPGKPWNHRRCEAQVQEQTARWRTHIGKDFRCELGALYKIQDSFFCKRHAGDYLIKHYLSGSIILERSKQ
jgi:hypothetical protein